MTDASPSPITIPEGGIPGEDGNGLETDDIYDGGPIIDEEKKQEAVIPPPTPNRPVIAKSNGRMLSSSSIMKHLKSVTNDSSGVMRKDGPRWMECMNYWLHGKQEVNKVLPRLNANSSTGPARDSLSGVRWIRADFVDGSGVIFSELFM